MSTIDRNGVVRLFGTPDETVGSVNEPRITVEGGLSFNEKWTYLNPRNEPSRPQARMIFWSRYDFVAAERIERDGRRVGESAEDLLSRSRP